MRTARRTRRVTSVQLPLDAAAHLTVSVEVVDRVKVGDILRGSSHTLTHARAKGFRVVVAENQPVQRGSGSEEGVRRGEAEPAARSCNETLFATPGCVTFPHSVSAISGGSMEASCRFLAEVHPGDTLRPKLIVTGLESQNGESVLTARSAIHDQAGNLVFSGQHKYFLRI
ncbi:dehydratase [Streptomyces sp. NBC_00059]|uniref:dehydratase n=1 Tax=Streptomyces sp. NBC_00059 TaxID=2975635 RepID=UPI002250ABF3|nr:dehydratase [Streptomyces sp. NBC_00059]MCX5414251.1 dehydratase [Streptomyces sp. NBC_00059]